MKQNRKYRVLQISDTTYEIQEGLPITNPLLMELNSLYKWVKITTTTDKQAAIDKVDELAKEPKYPTVIYEVEVIPPSIPSPRIKHT